MNKKVQKDSSDDVIAQVYTKTQIARDNISSMLMLIQNKNLNPIIFKQVNSDLVDVISESIALILAETKKLKS